MKATLEKINPGFGSSFTFRKFTDVKICATPHWHFHPEYEIVYISNGKGKRHIGNHISYYEDGDLIFLGPNLPHFGFCNEMDEEHMEFVVQMNEDFLGKDFLNRPELMEVKQIMERSKKGLSFSHDTQKKIGEHLEAMVEMDTFDRLLELLKVLRMLARSTEYEVLNAEGIVMEVNSQDHNRMDTIFRFVQSNYHSSIPLEKIAGETNMTVPAFCRYFKKLTQKTFTQFVNEFRVAYACKLLSDDDMNIANISYESGFNNLSHFNKHFKITTGFSPSEYRKSLKKIVDGQI